MRQIHRLLPTLLLAVTGACASSRGDASRPASPNGTNVYSTEEVPTERASPEEPSYPSESQGASAYSTERPAYPTDRPPYQVDSPYQVEIVSGDSRRLPTYPYGGRAYVLGTVGERYRIHITNPTPRRVEAVISVDGLDAIDGKTADYQSKRGYVIAAYGEISIDGFRTSLNDVATFRFSSVRDSYAGRKGQDRNVGVIGVAFFPQRELPVPRPVRPPLERRPPSDDPRSGAAPAPAPSAMDSSPERAGRAEARKEADSTYRTPAPESRPGLGTEFGENRYSHVDYTSFQRQNPSTPAYVAEFRYNDRQGLLALGIPTSWISPVDDTALRESAQPFPRSRFATPPPR
jgi:hypothetical protein